jgi:hypothetical protein
MGIVLKIQQCKTEANQLMFAAVGCIICLLDVILGAENVPSQG